MEPTAKADGSVVPPAKTASRYVFIPNNCLVVIESHAKQMDALARLDGVQSMFHLTEERFCESLTNIPRTP